MNNQMPFFYPFNNNVNQSPYNEYERLEEKIERLEKNIRILENRMSKLENTIINKPHNDYNEYDPTDMHMI